MLINAPEISADKNPHIKKSLHFFLVSRSKRRCMFCNAPFYFLYFMWFSGNYTYVITASPLPLYSISEQDHGILQTVDNKFL